GIVFSRAGGERIRRYTAALRLEVRAGGGIRRGAGSIYFSDDRDAADPDRRRVSSFGGFGIRFRLYCASPGDAGATARAVGGSILAALSSTGGLGGRHSRLLRRARAGAASDGAA